MARFLALSRGVNPSIETIRLAHMQLFFVPLFFFEEKVIGVGAVQATQMSLPKSDDVTLAAQEPDQSLGVRILPRAGRGRKASRSLKSHLGALSSGKASMNCCAVHRAVGVLGDREVHDPAMVVVSNTITNGTRPVRVGTIKKSIDIGAAT
jgi:hypothetical protein